MAGGGIKVIFQPSEYVGMEALMRVSSSAYLAMAQDMRNQIITCWVLSLDPKPWTVPINRYL